MQDLHVIDVLPQMITLSEAYIQVNPGEKRDFKCSKSKLFSNLVYFQCKKKDMGATPRNSKFQ
jgi:hypothetical protein